MNDLQEHDNLTGFRNIVAARDVPEPFNRPLECFLAGDSEREPDIDTLFSRDFNEVLKQYNSNSLNRGKQSSAVLALGYKFRIVDTETDSGVILISRAQEIVGAYIGCLLGISPEHRGRGLGAELVFEFAYHFGSLPVWHLDTPAYSPAGFAAHRRAWFLARNAVFLKAKRIGRFARMTIATGVV